jgi:hypothetical protein
MAQDLRREGRHAAEVHLLALGQRVADAQRAVVGDADDVAGPGLLGHLAFLGEEEQRRVDRHLLAGADLAQPHALGQPPLHSRTKATRSRWFGSMLAWTLNTKPVRPCLVRLDRAGVGGRAPGGGA